MMVISSGGIPLLLILAWAYYMWGWAMLNYGPPAPSAQPPAQVYYSNSVVFFFLGVDNVNNTLPNNNV